MLLNHKRETVRGFSGGDSLCPDCGAPLLTRKGEVKVWHWAHHPNRGGSSRCDWAETDWHLTWKQAHQQGGWQIEHSIQVNGKKYRLDAFDPATGRVREFVHSLSPSYAAKHQALVDHYGAGKVTWLYDGHAFLSERRKGVRNGGMKRLLKPTAAAMHQKTGGLVHIQSGPMAGIWRHWKHDVWYRTKNGQDFLSAYAAIKQQAVAA